MEDDWDLHAVVRSCSAAAAITTSSSNSTVAKATTVSGGDSVCNSTPCFSPNFCRDQVGEFLCLPDPSEARNSSTVEGLHELFKPFFPKLQTRPQSLSSLPNTPVSSFSSLGVLPQVHTQQKQQTQQIKLSQSGSVSAPRSKRRKNQLKKVCHVPAECLSSDIWAWRKYGQKPIKGSPFPRGYYRCSTSKGCLARKQVERNRSDPGMFIVTYTGEHNHPAPTHRNSLAGSTRQKALSPQTFTTSDGNETQTKQSASSSSPSTEEETTESKEKEMEDGEEEDEFGIAEMAFSDDFFLDFEELDSQVTGDCFSDQFPADFGLPWMVNNAATATGSG